jgi:hypothetical protein
MHLTSAETHMLECRGLIGIYSEFKSSGFDIVIQLTLNVQNMYHLAELEMGCIGSSGEIKPVTTRKGSQ